MPFTNGDKRAAAEREAKQRVWVYPRLVANGRMKKATAEREIALMEEIAADYAKLEQATERLI